MFYIFEYRSLDGIEYLFTTNVWFSSNFDELQRLCEVGLDDCNKIHNRMGNPRIDESITYADCKFLFQTTNLETAYLDFPEYFI